jgi:hypothetical protein
MDLLTKEERENLIIEYKHYHDENWRRSQAIWVVNSILITGSLIVAFQNSFLSFPASPLSLLLVTIAAILHATGGKMTKLTYKRMEEIGKKLGINGPTELYRTHMKGKWWYIVRVNAYFILSISFGSVYLFLWLGDFYLTIILLSVSLILLLIGNLYSQSKN